MTHYTIHFEPGGVAVEMPGGTTLGEAARKAGFDSVILYGKRNFIHLGVS